MIPVNSRGNMMLQAFLNIWRIAELRNKLMFTMGMLCIYRIGFFIPLLGIDQSALADFAEKSQGTAMGNLISFVGIFTGGNFSQSTTDLADKRRGGGIGTRNGAAPGQE